MVDFTVRMVENVMSITRAVKQLLESEFRRFETRGYDKTFGERISRFRPHLRFSDGFRNANFAIWTTFDALIGRPRGLYFRPELKHHV